MPRILRATNELTAYFVLELQRVTQDRPMSDPQYDRSIESFVNYHVNDGFSYEDLKALRKAHVTHGTMNRSINEGRGELTGDDLFRLGTFYGILEGILRSKTE